MPAGTYPIYGKVYDTDGTTALSNVTVTIRNERTDNTTSVVTDGEGVYGDDLGNITGGFTDGDFITVSVEYQAKEDVVTFQLDMTTYPGGYEQDLTLVALEAGQLRYFTVQEFLDIYDLPSYDSDNQNGLKSSTILTVGQGVEAEIDRLTNNKWDTNNGSYYTVTNEYHNANGVPSNWPQSVDLAQTSYQDLFFTYNTPIYELTTFQVNQINPGSEPVWTTLTEDNNEIRVNKSIGRIEIVDSSKYPAAGSNQVRITYKYGQTTPADIKRLAILMTGRALAHYRLQRLNIDVTETAALSSAIQNLGAGEDEIDKIISNRRIMKIRTI